MKNLKRMLFVVAVVLMGLSASAGGFRFGVKAGVALNNLHFSEEAINDLKDKDNQAGFTGGVMAEFTIPVVNLGVDASLMYVHRPAMENENGKMKRDYIEIPVNFKYKVSLPFVGDLITPYAFTGPSFAFKTGKSEIKDFVKSKKCDIAWNVGLGVELFKHVQVGASYGFGITKAVELMGANNQSAGIDGKNRYWTITAAYLF